MTNTTRPAEEDGGNGFTGWYCAQCQRGVDSREVTYTEQHQACGRYITNDRPPAPGAAAAAPEPRNYWADLWYFVMDEAALDFESIVTNHPPKHWLGEAHKLFRAKHPARAAQAQGGKA